MIDKLSMIYDVAFIDLFDKLNELIDIQNKRDEELLDFIEHMKILGESVVNLIKLTEKQQKEIDKLKKV